MMNEKKEFILGRQGDIKIENEYVSRHHAKLIKESGEIFIEDLDSTGGTYVNGRKIKKKKIMPSDEITLGSHYVLDLNSILAKIPKTDKEVKEEFKLLEKVYEENLKSKVRLQSQSAFKMSIKRMLPMAVPGIIVLVLNFIIKPESNSLIMVSSILTPVGMIMGAVWGASEQGKNPLKLHELDEKYKLEYVCPSCHKYLGQEPWKGLEKQGKCPYCKRIFT